MNLLQDISLWIDSNDGRSPPITWNEEAQRFEILLSGGGEQYFDISMMDAVVGTDHDIEFDYSFTTLDPTTGDAAFLTIVENGGTVVHETNLVTTPEGNISFKVTEGNSYQIILSTSEGSYYSGSFQSIEGTISPFGTAVTVVPPWWLCLRPEEPTEPPPVRPDPAAQFISLAQYDADFRYPLASSRVPSKIKRELGCIVCGPELIGAAPGPGPNPEPEPEPAEAAYAVFGEGTYVYEFGFDPGFSRSSQMQVMQDGVQVANLEYNEYNGFPAWNGSFNGNYDSTQPVTFVQGSWECTRQIGTSFFFLRAELPQVFPTASYRSSNLVTSGDFEGDEPIAVTYGGLTYNITREIINGSYTWMFPPDFPNGVQGDEAVIQQYGIDLSPNCFLWSTVCMPVCTSYDGVMAAWNQQLDMNGFDHTAYSTVTFTRGSESYEGTRTGTMGSYQFEFTPSPPDILADPDEPWMMSWWSGSCYFQWVNNNIA